jgi:hypothetical protein
MVNHTGESSTNSREGDGPAFLRMTITQKVVTPVKTGVHVRIPTFCVIVTIGCFNRPLASKALMNPGSAEYAASHMATLDGRLAATAKRNGMKLIEF